MNSMMFLVDVVIVLMEGVLVFWIMQSLFSMGKRWKIPSVILYLTSILLLWLVTRSLHWAIRGSANLLLQVLLGMIVFEGKIKWKFLVTLAVSAIVLVVDLGIFLIANLVGYIDPADPSESYYVLSISSRIVCASVLGCAVLVYRIKLLHTRKPEWRSILGFSLIPILAAVFFIELYHKTEPYQETLIFAFCALLMVLMYFMSMTLQLKVVEVMKQRNISSFAAREMSVRKENYDNAQKLHREIYKMAHDLKHQIITLEELYAHSNEAAVFMDGMKAKLNHTLENHSYENLIIESTLKGYVQKAKAAGIEVALDANVYDEVKIQMIDLSTVLGNIFDNAIESCQRVLPGKLRQIKCSVSLRKKKLLIHLENSIGGVVRKENGRFLSSKADALQHGIGLVSVKQTVKKYFGVMEAYEKDGVFHCEVVMKNIKIGV